MEWNADVHKNASINGLKKRKWGLGEPAGAGEWDGYKGDGEHMKTTKCDS